MQIKNLPFRLESEFCRWYFRVTKQRPASDPFLSGDTYRSWADHIVEPGAAFRPATVGKGDLVFVESNELDRFWSRDFPAITQPFVLITSNGDPNIDAGRIARIDSKIIAWFAQNNTVSHPKVHPLPIGLENRALHYYGLPADFRRWRARPTATKRSRILFGFTVGTNPRVRQPALDALQSSPVAEALPRTNARAYRRILGSYQFVASPPGNGEDCHRTWEALYLRVVPIVMRSVAMESFARLGLPLWIIDDWAEVRGVRAEDLAKRYRELAPQFDHPALWSPYWRERIAGAQALEQRV